MIASNFKDDGSPLWMEKSIFQSVYFQLLPFSIEHGGEEMNIKINSNIKLLSNQSYLHNQNIDANSI